MLIMYKKNVHLKQKLKRKTYGGRSNKGNGENLIKSIDIL